MATEIGKLTAVYEADISKFEAGRKQVEAGLRKTAQQAGQSTTHVKQAVDGLSRSLTTINSPLSGITSQVSNYSGLATGAAGATTLWATAIGALIGAAVAGTAAIYNITVAAAEATGKMKDLSQQTGFAVETLSTLANVAETSGGSINTVSAALGIFEANMVEARDSTSEMSRLFKQLSIDTKDNEKALRQALQAIQSNTSAEERATIARKLFGRSGRELLAIVAEMPGTLDQATESMRGTTLITTEAAERGDELSDSITRLGQTFQSSGRIIADEFGPDVERTIKELTKVLVDSREGLRDFATKIADAFRGASYLAGAVKDLSNALRQLSGQGIPEILLFLAKYGVGGIAAFEGLSALGRRPDAGVPDYVTPFANATKPAFRVPNFSPFRAPTGTEKAGRAGGGRAEPKTVDGWTKALERLQRINEQLADEAGRFQQEMDRISSSVTDAMMDQAFAIKALESNTPDWLHRAQEFIRAKTLEGYSWAEDTKQIYLNNAARLEQFRILAEGATRARTVTMTKGGMGLADSFAGGAGKIDRAGELRDQYEAHAERMRDLAFNLTSALDRAIYDGFESGIKRGFQSLTLSILNMVQNVFLRQLENALSNALAGIGSGGGGGGSWFSRLLGIGIGAVAGGLGGGGFTKGAAGGGFAGKFQSGGVIGMGQWGVVHDNERVMATPYGAVVSPSGGGGGAQTNIYNIHVPVRSAGAYSSPKSRRQLAEDVSAAIQGSLA